MRSHIDAGRSGLSIKRRHALQDLIRMVQSGNADFEYILVYDVSRWGRFQDADEGAYYEYLCKRSGIEVRYCAEQFGHENNSINNIIKALKRSMAGEYSRELGVKVFAGQSQAARLGISLSSAPYGLRRLLLDPLGNPKQVLQRGQLKSVREDQEILIPGPEAEVRVVREIFDLCTRERKTPTQIARLLNEQKVPTPTGRPWVAAVVQRILENPKYKGDAVWARTTQALGTRVKRRPESQWIIKKNAIEPIVSERQFRLAAKRRSELTPNYTDRELLQFLREVLAKEGKLTLRLMRKYRRSPGRGVYIRRFGSMTKAFAQVGYAQKFDRDDVWAIINKSRTLCREVAAEIAGQDRGSGAFVKQAGHQCTVNVNGLKIAIRVLTYRKGPGKCEGWLFKLVFPCKADFLVCARMDSQNQNVASLYLFPSYGPLRGNFWMCRSKPSVALEAFSTPNLQPLLSALAQSGIPERVN